MHNFGLRFPTIVGLIPGAIAGEKEVCQNSTGNIYSITPLPSASSYTWTVPSDATITAGQGTNSITVSFGSTFTAGQVSVTPGNSCSTTGSTATLDIAVPFPSAAGTISGPQIITQGQTNVSYSVPAITNATSYTWTYSGTGATISDTTNPVTINFSSTATSGNLTVYGSNFCGDKGTVSAIYPITVVNSCFITATGGTVTKSGNYEIHTFTSPGTFTVTSGCGGSVEYLVVGGGGAGGYSCIGGGGGGAGGVQTGVLSVTTGTPYTISVGAGGSGAHTGSGGSNAWIGNTGGNSTFSTIIAYGGGGGAGQDGCSASNVGQPGGSGASGGGGTSSTNNTTGALGGKGGTATQGNIGGNGATKIVGSNSNAGGGGGAGAPGSNGVCGTNKGGSGGAGVSNSISGTSVYYAGGGGGSAGGAGGIGGGGSSGSSGTANTGGGGGGGTGSAGSGGSGIVIIRFLYK